MRQIVIKATGCHDCPIKTLDMHTLRMKEVENENT